MKARTLISLTGGLGNQLFQYAAGLYVADSSGVAITSCFGRPRGSEHLKADLYAFSQPLAQSIADNSFSEASWLSRKSAGFFMRSSFAPRAWESNGLVRLITWLGATIVTSFALRQWRIAYAPEEVGFDEHFSVSRYPRSLFGYFQTYRFPSDPRVHSVLLELALTSPSSWVREMEAISREEHPIAVHIRLTDYRSEGFGITPREYYIKALAHLRSIGEGGRIWLFSDEPEEAIALLGETFTKGARIIREPDGAKPAEVLEVMRLAKAYVIANSTFSWWGAFLSHSRTSAVCYPDPWFLNGPEIKDLCPPEWTAISR